LHREGDRQYYDTSAGETYTLRELYSLADVRPEAVLYSEVDALTPLEGLKLRVADMRVVHEGLAGLLDEEGVQTLDKEYLGAPGATAELPAAHLRGLSAGSRLGKKMGKSSIAEIAAQPVDEFVAAAASGAPPREKIAIEKQARELWNNASRVVRLGETWKAG
jgi:hypothetical protein